MLGGCPVGGHADHPDSTYREERQGQRIVSAIDLKARRGLGDELRCFGWVACGVFHAHDVFGFVCQFQQNRRLHFATCAHGDVIDDHRQIGGVRHRQEMLLQACLRRAVVIGRDGQHGRSACGCDLLGQFGGGAAVVAACAGDHGHIGRFGDSFDQGDLLFVGEGRGFACGARHD